MTEQEICNLYLDGLSIKKISEKSNHSTFSIYHILKKCNIIRKKENKARFQKQKVLQLYNSGLTARQTAKQLNLSFYSVSIVLQEEKAIRSKLKFSETLENKIAKEYEKGTGRILLAKKFNTSEKHIGNIIKRKSKTRTQQETNRLKYPLKENAFNEINEESAYWMGMLMADGCVVKSTKGYVISLALKKSDKLHIEKFQKFLGCINHKLHKGSSQKTFKNSKGTFGLSVTSQKLATKLIEYGITQRKSLTATPHPDLCFNQHFWRGMIDGDGSLPRSTLPIVNLVNR